MSNFVRARLFNRRTPRRRRRASMRGSAWIRRRIGRRAYPLRADRITFVRRIHEVHGWPIRCASALDAHLTSEEPCVLSRPFSSPWHSVAAATDRRPMRPTVTRAESTPSNTSLVSRILPMACCAQVSFPTAACPASSAAKSVWTFRRTYAGSIPSTRSRRTVLSIRGRAARAIDQSVAAKAKNPTVRIIHWSEAVGSAPTVPRARLPACDSHRIVRRAVPHTDDVRLRFISAVL